MRAQHSEEIVQDGFLIYTQLISVTSCPSIYSLELKYFTGTETVQCSLSDDCCLEERL